MVVRSSTRQLDIFYKMESTYVLGILTVGAFDVWHPCLQHVISIPNK